MVQRYRPDSDEQGRSFEIIPDEGGDYVAHEDYEELEKMVDNLRSVLESAEKQVEQLISERDKLAAENKRLAALNDMFPQEIARLEDRVSAEYEAERADDRARIKELEAERDADRRREYGYSQQTVDALTAERDKLEAENRRLREALKGFLQEAIVLTDDYLSMFETYHDTHVIQGWDKARWVRVSQAARDARGALGEASHES